MAVRSPSAVVGRETSVRNSQRELWGYYLSVWQICQISICLCSELFRLDKRDSYTLLQRIFIYEKCNAVADISGTCFWYSLVMVVSNLKWKNVVQAPNFHRRWTNAFPISFTEIVAQHLWGVTLHSQMLLMSGSGMLPNTGRVFY